jgi:hypothetical protein
LSSKRIQKNAIHVKIATRHISGGKTYINGIENILLDKNNNYKLL